MEPFDVVLLAPGARASEAGAAIELAGGRLLEAIDWADAAELMARSLGQPVLALQAEGVADALLSAALPHVRALAEALNLDVVATLARAQIDMVAAALIGRNVQLLCEPSLGELVAALAAAGRLSGAASPGDRWREGEAERLRRLNEEVARIAALLARLIDRERERDGDNTPDDVAERRVGFLIESPAGTADPQLVREAIRARRMRGAFLGENLFEDPAWDMLLDLYAAHLEGGRVSVSSLCVAAAVAPTTALRWIGQLIEVGLFDLQSDPDDRTRTFIALSPKALAGMDGYFAAARRADALIM